MNFRYCLLIAGLLTTPALAQGTVKGTAQSALDANVSSIGYPTVAAALAALRVRNDVKISEQGGWTLVVDDATKTLWTFTAPGHPAHPSVVRRMVVQRDGAFGIEMKTMCEAQKSECDKLRAEYRKLNDGLGDKVRQQTK